MTEDETAAVRAEARLLDAGHELSKLGDELLFAPDMDATALELKSKVIASKERKYKLLSRELEAAWARLGASGTYSCSQPQSVSTELREL